MTTDYDAAIAGMRDDPVLSRLPNTGPPPAPTPPDPMARLIRAMAGLLDAQDAARPTS